MGTLSVDTGNISTRRRLGVELTALREARELNQVGLAKISGISLNHVKALEQGRLDTFSSPAHMTASLKHLCRVLGTDAAVLAKQILSCIAGDIPSPDREITTSEQWENYIYAGLLAIVLAISFLLVWFFVRF